MSRRNLRGVCATVFFAWFVNFFAFLIGTIVLGGAPSGAHPPKDGRYYLAEHGHVTEVSLEIYRYSKIHKDSLWIGVPFVMVALIVTWHIDEKDKADRTPAARHPRD